jgi:hypothetical protein
MDVRFLGQADVKVREFTVALHRVESRPTQRRRRGFAASGGMNSGESTRVGETPAHGDR